MAAVDPTREQGTDPIADLEDPDEAEPSSELEDEREVLEDEGEGERFTP